MVGVVNLDPQTVDKEMSGVTNIWINEHGVGAWDFFMNIFIQSQEAD